MPKHNSYARFFHPNKSPHGFFDVINKRYIWPKHRKRAGHVVWDSWRLGTYVKARHGLL